MQIIKTILADDQRIFIEGLKTVLRESSSIQFKITGIAYDGRELTRLLQCRDVELLILDLNLPNKDGLEVLKYIRKKQLPVHILIFSRYNDPKIIKSAFKAGADGYILKNRDVNELFEAIREVYEGNTFVGEGVAFHGALPRYGQERAAVRSFAFKDGFIQRHHLTKRELEILSLIAEALSNKEIAKELYISDQTVSVHRKNIMRKLGVSNTAALIKAAYDNSLV